MSSLKRNFLLIGPWDPSLVEIGALVLPSLGEAPAKLAGEFDVIGVTVTNLLESRFKLLKAQWRKEKPWIQFVVLAPKDFSPAKLCEFHNDEGFAAVLKEGTPAEPHLYAAHETARALQQDIEMEILLREREDHLRQLQSDLEGRVEQRTRSLAESRSGLHLKSVRLEGLRKALLAAQESSRLTDMEKSLNRALQSTVETSWIRVVPAPRDQEFALQIDSMDGFARHQETLFRHQDAIGSIFFMRAKEKPFRKDDIEVMRKVSEAVSLAVDRLRSLDEAEALEQQWQTTFHAISDLFSVIDPQYEVLQSNREQGDGGRCYQRFFGRSEPCIGCDPGRPFRIENQGRTYEVLSQKVTLDSQKTGFAHLYTDITDRLRMENRILESAGRAELGTIGSSIAHELNNPLGGILNFAQLLKMDLPKDHPLQPEMQAIEDGAKRCKEIVESLLAFTRAPQEDPEAVVDLREPLKRALRIVQLQSRALGIELEVPEFTEAIEWKGPPGLVSQAFKHVLQAALQSARQSKGPAKVQVEFSKSEKSFEIRVRDNGQGLGRLDANEAFGLALASRILSDLSSPLEISSPSSPDSWAKISFSRPVLRS